MNPNEQKNHKRVTDSISERLDSYVEATDAHLSEMEEDFRTAIGAERTHRLKLADEQRGYVDGEDRKLRVCCQERWDATSEAQGRIIASIAALRDRGFWGRLNWLMTGR